MKYKALLAFIALCGCTEPGPQGFEGTIVSRATVVDAFQNTTITELLVDKDPGSSGQAACSDQADVSVTAETSIARESAPNQQVSEAVLTVGTIVRVLPATDPRDVCPMRINATSVVVVGQ